MSLASQVDALAARVASEVKAVRSEIAGRSGPPTVYQEAVLADSPVAYFAVDGSSTNDLSGNGHSLSYPAGASTSTMPNGEPVAVFDGTTQYAQIADAADLSVPNTGTLTVEVWVRPDTLEMPGAESSGDGLMCHFLGKGETANLSQEYAFRFYNESASRPNRFSVYHFPADGGLGAGSYFQGGVNSTDGGTPPVLAAGDWVHVAAIYDTTTLVSGYGTIKLYRNGVLMDHDNMADYSTVPVDGVSPLRLATRDFLSFFQGAIGQVAVYDYAVPQPRLAAHFDAMMEPPTSAAVIAGKPTVRLGVFPESSNATSEAEFVAASGEPATVILVAYNYLTQPNATALSALNARGVTPLITWMPNGATEGIVNPNYQLADILAGTYDAYMTTFLNTIKGLGFPVIIKWAPEFNGDWAAWSEGQNGNTTGQFAQAWRHVWNLAASLGVTNVEWQWAPTSTFYSATPLAGLWPGAEYVDSIAVHGYNYGTGGPDGIRSASAIFDATFDEIAAFGRGKPLWLGEVGAKDTAGDKAAWIAGLLRLGHRPRHRRVRVVQLLERRRGLRLARQLLTRRHRRMDRWHGEAAEDHQSHRQGRRTG